MKYQWCRFEGFSAQEFYSVAAARQEVFVVEQKCPFQDLDSIDQSAWHLVAWVDGRVAGYLRVVDPGVKYPEPSIGRVITTKNFRGKGIGQAIMREALRRSTELYPGRSIRISAQSYLQKFYGSFGFEVVSEEYLEDDIPHREMIRTVGN